MYRTTHVQGEVVVFALVQLGDKFLPYQVRFVHKRTLELAGRLRPGMKLILETGCFGYRRGRQDKELRVKRFSLAATNQIQPRTRSRSLRRKRIDCIGWLPKPSRRNKSRRIRFPIALDRARLRELQPTDAAWFNTSLQGAFSDNVAECRGNLSFLVSQYSGGVAPNWSLDSFVRSGEEGGVETYDGEKHDA